MRTRRPRFKRYLLRTAAAALAGLALLAAAFALASWLWPFRIERLERCPASPRVTDRQGRMILETVGPDGQWCRPVPLDQISPWLVQATIAVEDKRFFSHPGVDAAAVVRAAWQNLVAGRTVSGASTLTMQLCRMIDDRPRTWPTKFVESFRALQLERLHTKAQILEQYLNRAPYGGNIRGVEAAAHRYFGKPAAELSLGEAALLAGLPQAPARYRPDRFPAAADTRRGVVLRRMQELGFVTGEQRWRAVAQPVRIFARSRPQSAQHAAWLALERRPGGGRTTIDLDLQALVECLAVEQVRRLPAQTDLAVAVVDIGDAALVALVRSSAGSNRDDAAVNPALARRSPGSALKPFIYATAFEAGRLGPDSTVYDVPIERAGWAPSNFDRTFVGPLSAAEALRRSLNVPAILVAEAAGLRRCIGTIEAVGIDLPDGAAARGGLAVTTGAIEVRLLDLVNGHATLGRGGVRRPLRLFGDEPSPTVRALSADVCAAINEVLSSHARRPCGLDWLDTDQALWFMWKTGTSAGRRDAWAIGHNTRYAIAVWVGACSGAAHVEYLGAESAEPLLAELFTLPAFRCGKPPRPAPRWTVARSLPPPREVSAENRLALAESGSGGSRSASFRITAPAADSIYLAVDGVATITCQATGASAQTWFLNDRLVPGSFPLDLALSPDSYELRCVDGRGQSSAVRFQVRTH